ncbi:MAG TPA: hypothetical protein VGG54_22720 [Trebonia sp.]|jgi:hypothetical protein
MSETTTAADGERTDWRVTFWFLNGIGWVQLGFAFVTAKSEQMALMLCTQRASKLGFIVNNDTQAEVRRETDGHL